MLVATTRKEIGRGSYRAHYAASRSVFIAAIRRTGLLFDSSFTAGERKRSRGVMLYLLLQGTLELTIDPEHAFVAPVAFCFDEAQFEGGADAPGVPFRNWGEPLEAVEIRLALTDLQLKGERPIAIELPAPVWSAAHRLAELSTTEGLEAACRALLRDLADANLISPRLAQEADEHEGRVARMWEAIRPFAERLDLLNSLDALSLAAGLSLRHLARELSDFPKSLRVPFMGWRETTKRYRIKLATLALSEAELSIAQVAELAGYGSTEAMNRAFRDEGIDAPSRVREALLARLRRLEREP
ncbi:MAG: AraC family transcriptional regulator [Polyangiaceae bacterium]